MKNVVILRVNLDYKPDDSCGFVIVGVYDLYPSKEEVIGKVSDAVGYEIEDVVCGKHYDFISSTYTENYV